MKRPINKTKPPKVSVCLPVFNGANYIAASIDSVLKQTFQDLRLIVVDNCSTDDTAQIVRGFADERISYYRNAENIGLVRNWNRALSLADGEYFCMWAHDDVMLPDNLQRKVALLDEHPSVGFVHSNLALVDDQGEEIGQHWLVESVRDYIESGISVFRRYVHNMPKGASIFIGTVVARRAYYEQLGGFHSEPRNTIDSEFLMRLMLFSDVACLSAKLVKYRHHAGETSAGYWGTLAYVLEHSLVSRSIIDTYANRIPNARSLQRGVATAFAIEALDGGLRDARRGNFRSAGAHLRLVCKLDLSRILRPDFWRLLVRIVAGRPGLWFDQRFRRSAKAVARHSGDNQ